MQYDKHQFIWDVINETVALRQYATKEERARLNIHMLAPMSEYFCVYGLMTGSCFSPRANQLIAMCCPKFFFAKAVSYSNSIEQIIENSDGHDANALLKAREQRTSDVFPEPMLYSSIEAYITLPESNRVNLVSYLRGETEELDIYF